MSLLAVIPARGGSKRIPRKNIKPFLGVPMIAHTLNAARQSALFDEIHVSTDDPDIARVAAEAGYPAAFPRTAESATDTATIFDVLTFVIRTYAARGETFDHLCLLYATSPFMDPEDLKKAYDAFKKGPLHKPLMAVAHYPAPVEWAFRMGADRALTPDQPGKFSTRSQDLQPAYFDAAMFTFFDMRFLQDTNLKKIDESYRGYVVPLERVTDIDSADDWSRAEALARAFL